MRTILLCTFLILPIGTALAQADRTGTGSGPLATQTAPNTTATGATKPPSRAASPTSRVNPDRRNSDERRMDRIDADICDGCTPR